MVRERGPSGRHDGQRYWTLPGGGIGVGETAEDAVRREVVEEVGLRPVAVRYLLDVPYPSGSDLLLRGAGRRRRTETR
ncbi:NUDIX domain-containing protein [Micromonospora sp. NPDC051925]|uniref:NUDIX domain-containing protein n=1 Tax=Micromonospora sp. NPDC051925 TaxID=3364288 RepID=UPI0037CC7BD8